MSTTQRSSFKLENVLGSSRKTVQQIKEAQAQTETKTASENDAAFSDILDSLTGEKTASESAPEASLSEVQSLLQAKVAELAGVNQSALIKEAQVIGAAVHDGFLARSKESEYHATKIAQVLELEDPELEKIAEEIGFNEGVKIAMAIAEQEIFEGQKIAAAELEQTKVACYNDGHMDTLRWLNSHAK